MSAPHDGGPAFPVPPERVIDNGNDKHWAFANPGMSLRDYFAGQALQGLLASHHYDSSPKGVAEYAYEHADAMLAARGGQKP